jgi:Ca2+-binding RTX toxin-like protein
MVSFTDKTYLFDRFDQAHDYGSSDYWNLTTISNIALVPNALDGKFYISYTFVGSKDDIEVYDLDDVTRPYYENFIEADSGLKNTINAILNPTGAYSVLFTDVANIDFTTPSTGRGIIDFGTVNLGLNPITLINRGSSYNDPVGQSHGDIWLTPSMQGGSNIGTAEYSLIIHEISHALGLKHSFESQPNEFNLTQQHTVMSYTALAGSNGGVGNEVAPSGLQLLDIAAIQEIYGRNYTTRDTDTVYNNDNAFVSSRPNNSFIYTIWDGGGNDTIDASGFTDKVTIDLRQGEFSSIGKAADSGYAGTRGTGLADNNVAIAYHAIIENAKGTDNHDILIGNAWKNEIKGGHGNDTIYGDGFVYDGNHGFTDVETSNPDGLKPLSDDDKLYGEGGNDTIYGGVGNDTIDGGTGADTIFAGAGDDVVIYASYDHSPVFITTEYLSGGDGYDTLKLMFKSDELTSELREDVLEAYYSMQLNNTISYTFNHLNLEVIGFENIEVWIDGQQVSLVPKANDKVVYTDSEHIYYDGDVYGNLHDDSAYGYDFGFYYPKDYSFSDTNNIFNEHGIIYQEGVFTTSNGGTVTITSDGGYQYIAPSPSFVGTDSFEYSITDASGEISTATQYINVLDYSHHDSEINNVSASSIGAYLNLSGHSNNATGSNYDDMIVIDIDEDEGNGTAYGGLGNDIIEITSGNGTYDASLYAYGQDGDDYIEIHRSYNVYASGGDGNDYMRLFGGEVLGYGDNGNDIIEFWFDYELVDNYATINGGNGDDIIYSIAHPVVNGSAHVTFLGGDGNDTLSFSKHHWLNGGIEIDLGATTFQLIGNDYDGEITGFENVVGTQAGDVISGDNLSNVINGHYGDDILFGGIGDISDILIGGNKDVILQTNSDNDTFLINLNQGVDEIHDYKGNDKIIFGTGITANNLSYHKIGQDLLIKHNGVDLVLLVDHFYNKDNVETLEFSDTSTLLIKDAYENYVTGSNENDNIETDKGNIKDIITAGGGNDTILTYAGDDVINSGDGNDIIHAGAGNDTVSAGNGDDKVAFVYKENSNSQDYYLGQSGNDTLELHFTTAEYTTAIQQEISAYRNFMYGNYDTQATTAAEYIFSNFGLTAGGFETLKVFVNGVEQAAPSVITGTESDDYSLNGTSGNDIILGLDGDDSINSGDGHDLINSGRGEDFIVAGNGNDTVYAGGAIDFVQGNNGDDLIYAGAGDDIVLGGNDNDTIHGEEGNDTLYGDAGIDVIYG